MGWFVACFLLTPLAAQETGWLDEFKAHWKTQKEFTLAVAELMPEADYDSFDFCGTVLGKVTPEALRAKGIKPPPYRY